MTTNYEKIKNMSIEEMAYQIEGIFSDGLDTDEFCDDNCFGKIYLSEASCEDVKFNCTNCYKQWLQQEAE